MKRKRTITDDDLFVEGMYHPLLDTKGYEVEAVQENNKTTSQQGVTAEFPELENLGGMFYTEVKDYQSLLTDRRDKIAQTFRYMLEQNNSTSATSSPVAHLLINVAKAREALTSVHRT